MEVKQEHLNGLLPVIVFDQDKTIDEENVVHDRTDESQPMALVGVMNTRPENLPANYVWFPWEPQDGNDRAQEYQPTPDTERGDGFLKLQHNPLPEPSADAIKDNELRREYALKQQADAEKAFQDFKATKGVKTDDGQQATGISTKP